MSPTLRITEPSQVPSSGLSLSADVVIVGSGASGAVMAYELSRSGAKVVVLEAGPYIPSSEFTEQTRVSIETLYQDAGNQTNVTGDLAVLQGSCVGGSTVVNAAVCFSSCRPGASPLANRARAREPDQRNARPVLRSGGAESLDPPERASRGQLQRPASHRGGAEGRHPRRADEPQREELRAQRPLHRGLQDRSQAVHARDLPYRGQASAARRYSAAREWSGSRSKGAGSKQSKPSFPDQESNRRISASRPAW